MRLENTIHPGLRFGQHRPKVAVVDTFSDKSEDIDGDGVPDLPHGLLVEKILKADGATLDTVQFEVGPGSAMLSGIQAGLEAIEHRVAQGERFDAVNLSQALMAPLQYFVNNTRITGENIKDFRNAVLQDHLDLEKDSPRRFPRATDIGVPLPAILDSMERLAQKGVKVYIAGGNEGPGQYNMLNLAKGSIGVSATDAKGKTTPFSADNSLLTKASQGIFSVTKVEGGFDLTGDGTPEVLDSDVSGGEPLVNRFMGKPLASVLATDEECECIATGSDIRLEEERVMSWQQLWERRLIPQNLYELKKSLGPYVVFKDQKPKYFFNVEQDGHLAFDPDGSHRKGAIHAVAGTSLASPNALRLDLTSTPEGPHKPDPDKNSSPTWSKVA